MQSAQQSKAHARRRLRRARAELAEDALAERGTLLAAALRSHLGSATTVLGYLPMPGEPDLMPFLSRHVQHGGQVLVPVLRADGTRVMDWVRWSPEAPTRTSSRFPVQEPVGPRLSHEEALRRATGPAAVLVPGLAVDTAGSRLGQGGGYYDRFAAQLSGFAPALRPELIGVVHAEEILQPGAFDVEDHDLRVGLIASEAGLHPAAV